jgi:D-alanyl-D-alanine carboxypeptidase/D-alanyl-D-alanine-endopeptidase (penicillin-binding protein 4)
MKHRPPLLSLFLRPWCLAVLLLLVPVAAARADLASDVDALLQDKSLKRAVVGVEIVRLGAQPAQDKTVYQRGAQTPLIPASNCKILTTAAALEKLGADFKFRTQLVAGEPDLAIIGAGDPTFGDGEFLKELGWNVTTVYENWADQLLKRRIKTIRDVVVDDSVFDENFAHSNWPANQLHFRYVAEVAGLNLNANVLEFAVQPTSPGQIANYATIPPTQYVTVRNTCVTGSDNRIWLSREIGTNQIILKGETPTRAQSPVAVTIHDPSMYAGTVFAEVLKRKGITVTGTVRRDRTIAAQQKQAGPAGKWRTLAIHETPIGLVLARANKDSVNLYAESLCKRLGHEASGGQPGSWENGTAAVGAFLKAAGVAESEFQLDDGCGLSKQNAVSAEAFAKVLGRNFHSPNWEAFRATLAVAATDGTLQDRFRGTDLKGRVFAKSGFVNGVCALSGYVRTRDNQWFAFSFLINKVGAIADAKLVQEKIVRAVDNHAATIAAGQ